MKTTKKVPIFLAGLTLVMTGMGGNLPVGALSGAPQEILAIAGETVEELSLKTNAINPYLKINTIEPKTGGVSGVVSVPEEGDWYIKKVVVAYMNFRQGVSEEEADQNLAALTGRKDDNWNIVSLYENYYAAPKKSQEIVLNQTQAKEVFANEPDIIYYAVELGTVVDGKWAETWWSRGKVDYRSCVHSGVFDKETMSCVRVEDEDTIRYLPRVNSTGSLIELPEKEEVITWKEEWRDVILADYEAIQNETELMWGYLNDGLTTLDEDNWILDGILKSVEHYDKADSKLLWVSQGTEFLKARIAEMRKFYEKSEVSDTSKLEILEKENTTLKQTNTVLENEKLVLEQANMAFESEKKALEQERDALATVNEELKVEKGELEQEILRLRTENEALRAEKDEMREDGDGEQENNEAMSENERLKQETRRMAEEMAEMSQRADRLEAEKVEIGAKNAELERSINEMAENMQSAQGATNAGKCEVINIVTEAKEAGGDEEKMENELAQDIKEQEVEVPNLGGEEVKTDGIWWWLIPVVGLMGVVILSVKRKFFRE